MKKIILIATIMIGCISFSIAQQPTTKPAKTATAKPATTTATAKPATTTVTAKPATAATAKPATAATAKPVSANGTVLKKDGTPDKRYKTAEPTEHLKKDGTPDKRYSENKPK